MKLISLVSCIIALAAISLPHLLLSQSTTYPGSNGTSKAGPLTPQEREVQKHYLAAKEALNNGDDVTALDELRTAAALAPKNAVIWYNVAVVESKRGDTKAAKTHLDKAVALGLPKSIQEDAKQLESKLSSSTGSQGAADKEKLQDVGWVHNFDRFKGENAAQLDLCNISQALPSLCLALSSSWSSDNDQQSPDGQQRVYSLLLFVDGSKKTVVFPRSVILLLDKTRRVYPRGSPACQAGPCDLLDPTAQMTFLPYLLADIGLSTSVEGKLDDAEFSLTADQIAAVKQACVDRHLCYDFGGAERLQGSSAMDVIKNLDSQCRSRRPSRRLEVTALTSIDNSGISVEQAENYDSSNVYDIEINEVKWSDLKLGGAGWECAQPNGHCVSGHSFQKGFMVSWSNRDDVWDADRIFGSLFNDGHHAINYAYYRAMFCGEMLSYHGGRRLAPNF